MGQSASTPSSGSGDTSKSANAPVAHSTPNPKVGKSGKKICCSCPETKKARDECILMKGEDDSECIKLIEAHKVCLRGEGFTVK
mmetsp:Transcript_46471/g.68695  ORF Transcript_46471/g.68695 Transcript_46471/m.68695 type:complete len:84 (-) Transcript_46471:294-545(-)|eukprot:CAMPEP_0195516094 /NCGR_PEP_ID=MMETSP0794_2-20130614/6934_1 /TAXON_ID=515487 /ORGANISM="Stephanopyxis turris, Strain CCMP 815" /LENGTH=83 /DNA_ID=CAMNT_0040644611 /DNA_START=74 /DNA_END=325 /DNA_ORIENTATION=-